MKSWLGFLLLFFIAGCSSQSGTPPKDHFYHLPPIQAAPVAQTSSLPTIELLSLRAGGVYAERALLYSQQATPLKLERYRYHFWAEAPAILIARALRHYLEAAGFKLRDPASGLRPDRLVRLEGEVVRFERQLGKPDIHVLVALRLRSRGPSELQLDKRYEQRVKVNGNSIHATVEGFAAALEKIFGQLSRDLRTQAVTS